MSLPQPILGFFDWCDRIPHVCGFKQCLFLTAAFTHHSSPLLSTVMEFYVLYGTFPFGLCHFKIIYTSLIFTTISS